jgi:hypothetical protein
MKQIQTGAEEDGAGRGRVEKEGAESVLVAQEILQGIHGVELKTVSGIRDTRDFPLNRRRLLYRLYLARQLPGSRVPLRVPQLSA